MYGIACFLLKWFSIILLLLLIGNGMLRSGHLMVMISSRDVFISLGVLVDFVVIRALDG